MKAELKILAKAPRALTVERAPEGFDVLAACEALRIRGGRGVFIARDDKRAAATAEAAAFFAPGVEIVRLPAWDCQPYDRVSPSGPIAAERTAALTRLAEADDSGKPVLVVTTVAAAVQRCAPQSALKGSRFAAKGGGVVDLDALKVHLARDGYTRVATVAEPGDFAIRGGVADIFTPGAAEPIRLDFFGDTLESVRAFDPDTQRTTRQLESFELSPVSEALLDREAVARFRKGYVAAFGAVTGRRSDLRDRLCWRARARRGAFPTALPRAP